MPALSIKWVIYVDGRKWEDSEGKSEFLTHEVDKLSIDLKNAGHRVQVAHAR